MIRIAALNDSWSGNGSQSNISLKGQSTKEAQEAEAYALYNKALSLLRNGKPEEAEETFRELIDHDFITEAYELLEERSDSDNVVHPEFQLLYSIYKNLAAMATERKDYKSAMESYLEAVKIDSSEVTVWYKIGQTALKIEDFQLAQLAFEQGLVCSPKHWPCLDNLITIMYALNNYFDCLYYIAKAFELDPHYEKGHALRNKMTREQPSLQDYTEEFFQYFEADVTEFEIDTDTAKQYVEEALAIRRRKQELSKPPEPERLSFPPKLKAYSWKCIGQELISLYDRATTSDPIISICLKMNMPDYTNVAAGEVESSDSKETEANSAPSKDLETLGHEKMDTGDEKKAAEETVDSGRKSNTPKDEKDGHSKEVAMEVDPGAKEATMHVDSGSEKLKIIEGNGVEQARKSVNTNDVQLEPGSEIGMSGTKETAETLESKTELKDKTSEKEDNKDNNGNIDADVKNEGFNESKKTEETEDSDMVESDDSVLEAFKTAQTLLEGLSPCKDGKTSVDNKDSVDGITGPGSDNTVKAEGVQDLSEKLKEIEKELNVSQSSNAKVNEAYEKSTQGPGVSMQEEVKSNAEPSVSTVRVNEPNFQRHFGSSTEQNIQKEPPLSKSSSFGFTPSLFPEPSIHPSKAVLSPLAMPSTTFSAAKSPVIGPSQVLSPLFGHPNVVSPLLGSPQLESALSGKPQGASPLVGIPSPVIGRSPPHASPLLGSPYVESPLTGKPQTASPLVGSFSPVIGRSPPQPSPLGGHLSSSSSLAAQISSGFPFPGQISSSIPLAGISSVSSPQTRLYSATSPLVGPLSSGLPLAGPFSAGTPLTGSLAASSNLIGQGHLSVSGAGQAARTDIITKDHGYTIPSINVIPVPNLDISINQTTPPVAHSSSSSPHKHSPILTSYLTSSPSSNLPASTTLSQSAGAGQPYSSTHSPLKQQHSGGFGHVSMAMENRQTGSAVNYQSNLLVPVTQSLLKTLDTPTVPSSLFIADFDDQSPGSRKGQKRKRISMATEEIMMYGKRRSARVRNTGKRKEEETVNYMELLQAFLPSSLKTVREDEVKEAEAKTPDQSISPVAMDTEAVKVESYQEWNEEAEVKKFLHENLINCGLMYLMSDYLHRVAKFEKCKWEDGLTEVYLAVFSRVRKHLNTPNIFCSDESPEQIREFCKVCLLWGEFQLDQWLVTRSKTSGSPTKSPKSQNQNLLHEEDLPHNYIEDIWYILACCGQSDALKEDLIEHCIRAYWVKARINMLLGNMDDAIACLERAQEYLQLAEEEENIQRIFVANVKTDNVVTQASVTALQESLQQTQSVEEIQRLSEKGDNEKVAELLLQTFELPKQKSKFLKMTVDASERQSQLCLLQNTLFNLGDLQKCLYWGEESFSEAYQQYQKATTQGSKSDWLKTIVKIFATLQSALEKDLSIVKTLLSAKLVRFSQNLVQMIDTNMSLHESVTDMRIDTLLPWILLYQLIKHEEDKLESLRGKEGGGHGDSDLDENMPSSQMLLSVSHDYLGSRSWCCKSDGAFLMFFMKVLKPKVFSESQLLDEYQQLFEQCVYCLYGHPNRRGRAKHLQDHNASGVTLQWEEAIDVFEYFKPKSMPEFDGYKHDTISAEMECLLKRILPLIPETVKDMGLTADEIQNFIEGVSTTTPDIPEGREVTLPVVSEIYYLLGDYYLKNKEVGKAIKFYIQDLCVNPSRLDSWAGMALARMSQLEQKLSSVELKMDMPVFKRSITALRCFKRAMEIDYSNCKLWIEYGSLAYILHSHASRQLQWKNWFAMKEDFLEIAHDSKEKMLQTAYNCFTKAAECCDEGSEEEWIMNYMTGKCLEKLGKPSKEYLPFYKKASENLHEGGAKYPKKIVYAYTTPHYAVEALEMNYRQHVSILKLLLKHPPDSPELDYRTYLTFIIEASRSPFAKRIELGQETRTDRDSASSADEGSCSGLPASKTKNTKYKIPSDDHTYVRQKSNQGTPAAMLSEASDYSQSQGQSREGMSLTSSMPSAQSGTPMVTTFELHSEQTSSQEHETLTTTKCPEQFIDQKPPLFTGQTEQMSEPSSSSAVTKQTSVNVVDVFMKSVSDAIDKAIKDEVQNTDDTNIKSESVSVETSTSLSSGIQNDNGVAMDTSAAMETSTKAEGGDDKKEKVQTDVPKQELTETCERKSVTEAGQTVVVDGMEEENNPAEREKNPVPVDGNVTKSDDSSIKQKTEYSVEEMVAIEMKKSPEEIHRDLVEMCFRGVELCLKRFPTHYKSHYRLAYIYVHSPYHKNLTKARNILLGAPKWSQFDYMPCQGLFFERKPTKFFQGIWKIPIDEIDRSGSFPAHLNKCIALLLDVLKRDRDPAMLFQIHLNLNRQPEAGKKYLRDAERKFYTVQSFKSTLDAIEQQTNAMKLVTDVEARLKYLMTVYKIREHGVHKLNRDVERLNRLFAEAYRVALRKLETLPINMLLSEALRFCKHQQAKKTMGGDKNQGSVTSKPVTPLSVKPVTQTQSADLKTSMSVKGITPSALKNIIGPQKTSVASQQKATVGLPMTKISVSVPSKTVSVAQKLISLAKISKIGKSQSVGLGLVKANKPNINTGMGAKTLKINLTDIAKGTKVLVVKAEDAVDKQKDNTENISSNAVEKQDDVIVLSDESERENSPTKAPPSIFKEDIARCTEATAQDAAKAAITPAPTVKIKMGLLQLAKLKQQKGQEGNKTVTESEGEKGETDESESEAPVPEETDMDGSVDDEIQSSTTSSSSSSSSDSSSESDDSEDNDGDDNDDDSSSSDENEESDASKLETKSKSAISNVTILKKSGVTIPQPVASKKSNSVNTETSFTKKANFTVPKAVKAKQSLLSKCKRTVGRPVQSVKSTGTVLKAKNPQIERLIATKNNDTDDADDEGVTESEIDDVVILDDEDDDKSQTLDDDSADDNDDNDDENDKNYTASADEQDLSDFDDDDIDNDDEKDDDVVMISESESEDEFTPKGRAIIPSPPHSKLKDMEKTVVLVSEMPDIDPILTSIISSETD